MHRAQIVNPDDSERRIVNSMMLAAGGLEELGEESSRQFVATVEVSKKLHE